MFLHWLRNLTKGLPIIEIEITKWQKDKENWNIENAKKQQNFKELLGKKTVSMYRRPRITLSSEFIWSVPTVFETHAWQNKIHTWQIFSQISSHPSFSWKLSARSFSPSDQTINVAYEFRKYKLEHPAQIHIETNLLLATRNEMKLMKRQINIFRPSVDKEKFTSSSKIHQFLFGRDKVMVYMLVGPKFDLFESLFHIQNHIFKKDVVYNCGYQWFSIQDLLKSIRFKKRVIILWI